MSQGFGHGLLSGHINVLALAGDSAMGVGKHGSGSPGRSAVVVEMGKSYPRGARSLSPVRAMNPPRAMPTMSVA